MNETAGGHWLDVARPRDFLHEVLPLLAGQAHIAFEGVLRDLPWPAGLAFAEDGDAILHRAALRERTDFRYAPLEPATLPALVGLIDAIFADARLRKNVWHISVEKDGELQLGAYDNFHRDCVVTGPAIPAARLASLKQRGVLRAFQRRESSA